MEEEGGEYERPCGRNGQAARRKGSINVPKRTDQQCPSVSPRRRFRWTCCRGRRNARQCTDRMADFWPSDGSTHAAVMQLLELGFVRSLSGRGARTLKPPISWSKRNQEKMLVVMMLPKQSLIAQMTKGDRSCSIASRCLMFPWGSPSRSRLLLERLPSSSTPPPSP